MCASYYSEQKYVAERLDRELIDWYDRESVACKRFYLIIKLVEMTLSASIPLVIGFWPDINQAKFCAALFGATVVLLNGIHGLFNFHERWIQYRSICEALKQEKYLFRNRCDIYGETENPLELLVRRVEGMAAIENKCWAHSKKCPAPELKP